MHILKLGLVVTVLMFVSLTALAPITDNRAEAQYSLPSVDILANDGECVAKSRDVRVEATSLVDDLMMAYQGVQEDSGETLTARHCWEEWRCRLVAVYYGNGTYLTVRECWQVTVCR